MKDAITNCGTSQNYGWKNEFHHLGITFLFPENKVNTMTADALTPSVARTSAAMASTVYDKSLLVFHGEAFPLHAPSQYRGMIENGNLFLCWQFSITKHTAKYNPHRLYHWKYFLQEIVTVGMRNCRQSWKAYDLLALMGLLPDT